MDLTAFQELVREFLRCNFSTTNGTAPPDSDDDLFETGLIDSQGFLQLVLHIEARTGTQIDITMAEPEHFSTIRGLFQLAQPADAPNSALPSL